MADLFGPKCKTHGIEIHDDEGNQTEQFRLWCRKCDTLTAKQIAQGIERVEYRCATNAQKGKESWPPSYAEFIGFCTASWETAAHKPFAPLALPDKAAEERARIAGADHIARMKTLFGCDDAKGIDHADN